MLEQHRGNGFEVLNWSDTMQRSLDVRHFLFRKHHRKASAGDIASVARNGPPDGQPVVISSDDLCQVAMPMKPA
jgi:hypothetical protein